jgi:RimJ/RimL family protein N-acetyltransferase
MTPRTIQLQPFDPKQHLSLLRTWTHLPHVLQWWGDSGEHLDAICSTPRDTHAIITVDDNPVGYLCWEAPPRSDLDAAGLSDLPSDLVDIDILIGNPDSLGEGLGPTALGLLMDILRADSEVSLAGIGTSVANDRAVRAFEKAGFELFREFEDPEHGRCRYMVADVRGES